MGSDGVGADGASCAAAQHPVPLFPLPSPSIPQAQFNDGPRVTWGGGIMGMKSQHKTRARERVLAKELAQRLAV